MSSKAVPVATDWTCDRCGDVQREPGTASPRYWSGVGVCRYDTDVVSGDYCPSCTAGILDAMAPLVSEPYPGATETTMGGR